MKKTGMIWVFVLVLSIQVFGQNVEKTLSLLSENKNVEKISVGSFGVFFAKLLGGKDALEGLKGLKSLEIYALNDECSAHQKTEILNQLKKMKDDQVYSTLVRIKDDDDHVRLMVKKEKDTIKEVVLIVLSDEEKNGDVAVIRLKGSFKESDLVDLAKKTSKKEDGR